MPVPAKSKKAWEQLAAKRWTEIAPTGRPNMPSEMITSVVEAIYDDLCQKRISQTTNFRREDLKSARNLCPPV